jgi:hypothetical protein
MHRVYPFWQKFFLADVVFQISDLLDVLNLVVFSGVENRNKDRRDGQTSGPDFLRGSDNPMKLKYSQE